MTNSVAISLAVLILGFFALDFFVLEWESHIWMMQKLSGLITTLAIWR